MHDKLRTFPSVVQAAFSSSMRTDEMRMAVTFLWREFPTPPLKQLFFGMNKMVGEGPPAEHAESSHPSSYPPLLAEFSCPFCRPSSLLALPRVGIACCIVQQTFQLTAEMSTHYICSAYAPLTPRACRGGTGGQRCGISDKDYERTPYLLAVYGLSARRHDSDRCAKWCCAFRLPCDCACPLAYSLSLV